MSENIGGSWEAGIDIQEAFIVGECDGVVPLEAFDGVVFDAGEGSAEIEIVAGSK